MKVLISAYACEPGKGSEPGVGWSWSLAAAQRHEVWVLTRANNRGPIEAELARRPSPSLHPCYLDLPAWALRWKRGRLGLRLYYVIWQLLAAREARRLQRLHGFDVTHHLTFANLWLPALVCLAGPPFVLGPVGGGQRVPLRLYRALGPLIALQELLQVGVRPLVSLNPLTRVAWRRAAVILVNNEETLAALPKRYRSKARLRPNACAGDELIAYRRPASPEPVAVYAGRLNRFKGVELALRALEHAENWQLIVVGDGPDRDRLHRLAQRLGVAARTRFEPWLDQRALWETMAGSRALLFPSLKEGAPAVVAEAQALGLPVVAFERGGVAALARLDGARAYLVPADSWRSAVRGLADALLQIEREPPPPADPDLGTAGVARDLDRAYSQAASQEQAMERIAA